MPFNTTDKAPFTTGCHLRAIFGRPETYEDAQTQKVLFLCNCCSTTVVPSLNHQNCCIGTTRSHKGVGVDAEPLSWWLKGCRGRRMEAQWSPQWSLNGRHWSAKGGTMVVQGRQRYRSNWYTMFTTVRILPATNVLPLRIHSAITVMRPASFEWPVSDRLPWRLFWTCSKLHGVHGVHDEVWTSSVPPLNDQGKLSASFVPSTVT